MESILGGHSGGVLSITFCSDETLVVSGPPDKSVQIWNADTDEMGGLLERHSNYVMFVAFSHDGRRVVSGSTDKSLRIWDTITSWQFNFII